jgi:hypothetical protein
LVQPNKHPRRDGEVKREIRGVEQAGERRRSARSVLHVRFDKEVEPALERDDSLGVVDGVARVAGNKATGEFVEDVQAKHAGCFAPQRVTR